MIKNEGDKQDQIHGNTIILYDDNDSSPKVLKEVRIITSTETKSYAIRKTKKGGYLFN